MNTKLHNDTQPTRLTRWERRQLHRQLGYKRLHDGTLYLGGLLQLPKWAKRHDLGATRAKGSKVRIVPMDK